MTDTFAELWDGLRPIGRDPVSGGYRRHGWDAAEAEARAWFRAAAADRGLRLEEDRDGGLWAWWGEPGPDAVVTGSHLDSVPDGGAFDGPLGVVSAFAAVDALRAAGRTPTRPLAVVAFAEEEGARFGIACLGSRLLTGALDPGRARELTDRDGVRLAAALERAGTDPDAIGPDPDRLAGIGCFVELHVEQGRALVDLDAAVGVATAIWPHGRWRLDFAGAADHAGTTRLADRRDPMLTFANTVLAARKKARLAGSVATVGRVEVVPNGTNAIPSHVRAWLDARAPEQDALDATVAAIERAATERGDRDGVAVALTPESVTAATTFDAALRDHLAAVLAAVPGVAGEGSRVGGVGIGGVGEGSEGGSVGAGGSGAGAAAGTPVAWVRGPGGAVPLLGTGAGHDAGVLATAGVPTAMLFVRNPTGVSHSPAEHAEPADCERGVEALTALLADLACGDPR